MLMSVEQLQEIIETVQLYGELSLGVTWQSQLECLKVLKYLSMGLVCCAQEGNVACV